MQLYTLILMRSLGYMYLYSRAVHVHVIAKVTNYCSYVKTSQRTACKVLYNSLPYMHGGS